MALTQSARLAGPSWDEEVVPALRKRTFVKLRFLNLLFIDFMQVWRARVGRWPDGCLQFRYHLLTSNRIPTIQKIPCVKSKL